MSEWAGIREFSRWDFLEYLEARGYSRQLGGYLYIKHIDGKQHCIVPPTIFTVYCQGEHREFCTIDKRELKHIGKEIRRAALAYIFINVVYTDIDRKHYQLYVIDNTNFDQKYHRTTWTLFNPYYTGQLLGYSNLREQVTMDFIKKRFYRCKFAMGVRIMKQQTHTCKKRIW